MLAYALFKQSVREEAALGHTAPGNSRNPTPATVKAFRNAAEQMLVEVVNRGIAEATPEIQQSAILSAVGASSEAVKAHIDRKTSFRSALLTNILAWIVTLAATVLIVMLLRGPAPEDTIANSVERLTMPDQKALPER